MDEVKFILGRKLGLKEDVMIVFGIRMWKFLFIKNIKFIN